MGTQKILDLDAGLFAPDLNVILISCFYQIVGRRTSMTLTWPYVISDNGTDGLAEAEAGATPDFFGFNA
jgi:hypothetical protein